MKYKRPFYKISKCLMFYLFIYLNPVLRMVEVTCRLTRGSQGGGNPSPFLNTSRSCRYFDLLYFLFTLSLR
jgi:hypothetical protein